MGNICKRGRPSGGRRLQRWMSSCPVERNKRLRCCERDVALALGPSGPKNASALVIQEKGLAHPATSAHLASAVKPSGETKEGRRIYELFSQEGRRGGGGRHQNKLEGKGKASVRCAGRRITKGNTRKGIVC